jgi:hypothetical protein
MKYQIGEKVTTTCDELMCADFYGVVYKYKNKSKTCFDILGVWTPWLKEDGTYVSNFWDGKNAESDAPSLRQLNDKSVRTITMPETKLLHKSLTAA